MNFPLRKEKVSELPPFPSSKAPTTSLITVWKNPNTSKYVFKY